MYEYYGFYDMFVNVKRNSDISSQMSPLIPVVSQVPQSIDVEVV